MHDSVGLHLGTSLQSAKLQVTTSKFTAKLLLLSHSDKNSSGDEIANVNFFYNIAHVEAIAYAH